MSDTPISDSTPHNVADLGMLCRRLERLAAVRLDYINQLEANNNAANVEIEEKRKDIVYLATEKAKLENYVMRLEEAGNEMAKWLDRNTPVTVRNDWRKAKEDKL